MLIHDEKQIDTYYQALLNRSPEFVGSFFVGVKTTLVFCIATCRARKPKRENVEFYRTFKDALEPAIGLAKFADQPKMPTQRHRRLKLRCNYCDKIPSKRSAITNCAN